MTEARRPEAAGVSRRGALHAVRRWPSLGALMVLIAGLSLGLALVIEGSRSPSGLKAAGRGFAFLLVVMGLGGLSLVGPPLLLFRRRAGYPWGAGRFLWFSTGTAAWLLWPPIVYRRVARGGPVDGGGSTICFAYGTPLMALYVTAALLAGGWLRRGRRRRAARDWRESFGLILGLAWALSGLYVLYLIYSEDF